MASYKATLIIMSFVLLFDRRARKVVVAEPLRSAKSKCECGVFKFPTALTTRDFPLIAGDIHYNFECNADLKESCSNTCRALFGTSKGEAPTQICRIIRNTHTPFVPVIYYRACGDDVWTFTEQKSTRSICCNSMQAVPCI